MCFIEDQMCIRDSCTAILSTLGMKKKLITGDVVQDSGGDLGKQN